MIGRQQAVCVAKKAGKIGSVPSLSLSDYQQSFRMTIKSDAH